MIMNNLSNVHIKYTTIARLITNSNHTKYHMVYNYGIKLSSSSLYFWGSLYLAISSATMSAIVSAPLCSFFLDGPSFAITRYLIASVAWSSFFTGASLAETVLFNFARLYFCTSLIRFLHDLNIYILGNFKSSFIRFIHASTSLLPLIHDTPRSAYSSATLQGNGLSGVGSCDLAKILGSAITFGCPISGSANATQRSLSIPAWNDTALPAR